MKVKQSERINKGGQCIDSHVCRWRKEVTFEVTGERAGVVASDNIRLICLGEHCFGSGFDASSDLDAEDGVGAGRVQNASAVAVPHPGMISKR